MLLLFIYLSSESLLILRSSVGARHPLPQIIATTKMLYIAVVFHFECVYSSIQ